MKLLGTALAVATSALLLIACAQSRDGGELRLKHIVTISTDAGERTFSSVVSMDALQTHNYGFGSSGWGGIGCKLTGKAVRATVGDRDFYFLLAKPGASTPAWTQIGLIKSHFGLPNYTNDSSWVRQWRELARSTRGVNLTPDAYPAIAIMPRGGWMDDARLITPQAAEQEGLHVLHDRVQITGEPVAADPPFEVRYRRAEDHRSPIEVGRESFSVVSGRS